MDDSSGAQSWEEQNLYSAWAQAAHSTLSSTQKYPKQKAQKYLVPGFELFSSGLTLFFFEM